ncbi:DUF378 domain-containing protein [Achromobacter sp. NPDC058515]|uniref:DUF378 domain-containing protein n=1 Tax=Achromobacter sp. NPDC058515 TaxID=3346533 RepID=UPI003646B545
MEISGNDEDLSEPEAAPTAAADLRRRGLSVLDWTALIGVVAGGLNYGLIAAVNLDVFARILPYAAATRIVHGLVGLAALYCVVLLFRLGQEQD